MGGVHASMEASSLRQGLHHVYDRLKRNKALPDLGGLAVAVLDGHEPRASYRRRCAGCLERTIHTVSGDRLQSAAAALSISFWLMPSTARPPF